MTRKVRVKELREGDVLVASGRIVTGVWPSGRYHTKVTSQRGDIKFAGLWNDSTCILIQRGDADARPETA